MTKTIQNAVKRMNQAARIAKAYDMPIVNFDMVKNDENVKKFFGPNFMNIDRKKKKFFQAYFLENLTYLPKILSF